MILNSLSLALLSHEFATSAALVSTRAYAFNAWPLAKRQSGQAMVHGRTQRRTAPRIVDMRVSNMGCAPADYRELRRHAAAALHGRLTGHKVRVALPRPDRHAGVHQSSSSPNRPPAPPTSSS